MPEIIDQRSENEESALALYAREFAAKTVQHKEEYAKTDSSALVFRLGQELYALPTAALREVLDQPKIHTIPHRRNDSIIGLASFRGELLLCVSLKRLLGIAPKESAEPPPALLLVLGWHGFQTGCLVDEVRRVCRFCKENLRPHTGGKMPPGLVLGLLDFGEGVASVLSADAIVALTNERDPLQQS